MHGSLFTEKTREKKKKKIVETETQRSKRQPKHTLRVTIISLQILCKHGLYNNVPTVQKFACRELNQHTMQIEWPGLDLAKRLKKKKKRDYNGSNSQYKTCSYISDYRLL